MTLPRLTEFKCQLGLNAMKNYKTPTKFLTRKEILEITGKSNPTVWRWTKAGTFPKPYKLGERSVGWKDNEIQEWIASRERKD